MPLAEVADLALGKMLDKAKRTRGTLMPYLRNINVRWDAFDLDDLFEMPFEVHELDRYAVRAGDVVVCEGGEPGRAAVWQGASAMFQKALHRVRPRADLLDPRWLVWHLRYDASSGRLSESFTGTTIKHLTGSALARYEITLPPVSEQRRIVAKLDELLASSRAARTALDAVPAMLERYRQAVLAAAFAHAMAVAETAQRLDSLVAIGRTITYGIVQTGTAVPDGVPTIRCGDIKRFSIVATALKRVACEIEGQYPRTRLRGGEVLIAIRGSVGETAVATSALAGSNVSREVAVIPVRERVDPDYAMYLLASPPVANAIGAQVKGVAQSGINIADLRNIELPLPTHADQVVIATRIRSALASIEALSTSVTAIRSEVERFEAASLSKALRGELVPQDPADEPASALLARLRAERASAPNARSRRAPARA